MAAVRTILPLQMSEQELARLAPKEIGETLLQRVAAAYDDKEREVGPETMRLLERLVMLRVIDSLWVEHLTHMEHMRLEAGWQTLRQTRAVDAYKREGYAQFQALLEQIRHDVAHTIFHAGITRRQEPAAGEASPMEKVTAGAGGRKKPGPDHGHKVGRNDPCPCGSGKKYKHCCGR